MSSTVTINESTLTIKSSSLTISVSTLTLLSSTVTMNSSTVTLSTGTVTMNSSYVTMSLRHANLRFRFPSNGAAGVVNRLIVSVKAPGTGISSVRNIRFASLRYFNASSGWPRSEYTSPMLPRAEASPWR